MEADGQFSKLVSDIPNPDIAISMGCNVGCPFIGRPFDDNWGLEDPTGKSDEEFKIVIENRFPLVTAFTASPPDIFPRLCIYLIRLQ